MNKLQKLVLHLGWVSIVLGIGLIFLIFYWVVFPVTVLTFTDKPFHVLTPILHRRDQLLFETEYCKYKDFTTQLTREFVNDLIYITPTITTTRALGCHTITVNIDIPKELPPGTYYVHNTYKFKVNPLKMEIVTHDTEPFTVIE